MSEMKIALVTGAARGIGKATALSLAKRGAKIYATDINEKDGHNTVDEISFLGGTAEFMHLDVSQQDQVDQVVQQIMKNEGKLDWAVNNAGIGGKLSSLHEVKQEDWEKMMSVNLSGVFYCMQAELKAMLVNGSGSIVNVSSLAGLNGAGYGSPYSAAKHAVIGLTKSAAIEYGKLNIRVNAICPGFVETDIIKDLPDSILNFSSEYRVPLKRLGKPDEIANSISFLLSKEASYITGMTMNVGGGYQAN